MMTDWGAHHFDIAQWGLGMDDSGPVEIYPPDGKDFPTLTYKYANGVTVICGPENKMGARFDGEKGSIYVNRGNLESTPEELVEQPLADEDVHLYVSKNHHQNWLECIKSRKSPICDVEIGHRSATVCHLGNIAIRTGRKINWDPAKQEIIGDAEASKRLTSAYRAPWKLPTA